MAPDIQDLKTLKRKLEGADRYEADAFDAVLGTYRLLGGVFFIGMLLGQIFGFAIGFVVWGL